MRRPPVRIGDYGTQCSKPLSMWIKWFRDPYWHRPKLRYDTVYEVNLVCDSRTWRVSGGMVATLVATRFV
jgi:hypothetical protein